MADAPETYGLSCRSRSHFVHTVSESYNHPDGVALAPFFPMVKVMVAISRARVRRAMVGRIPMATPCLIEIVQRARIGCWPRWLLL